MGSGRWLRRALGAWVAVASQPPSHQARPRPSAFAPQLVRADFKYFGLQGKVEGSVLSSQRDLFAKTHAQAFTTQDEWIGLTMADVRKLEDEVRPPAR